MIERLGRLLRSGLAACRVRPWSSLYASLAVAAVAATWRAQASLYVGDNRFEQYWNPGRRLARSFAAWDGSRGLGRVREDFWPGVTAPIAVFRAVGLSPAAAEHLFHALLLTVLGIGVVALVRVFRPTFGMEHVAAGAIAMFGPYSATFLIPTNLYASLALSPWLALTAVRGLQAEAGPSGDRARWRWASVFTILVFLAGNTDPPGLMFALLPAIVLGIGTFDRDGSGRQRTRAWLVRVVPLALAGAAVAITKVWLASATFGQRLADTESPKVTSLSSSFSESWRGLGLWLAYFRDGTGAARPQSGTLIAAPPLVIATFALPVLALVGLTVSRWSRRWAFALMAGLSLVLLAGAYPTDDPSRFGEALLWVYENVPFAAAFRSGYKAGAGLAVGTAVLGGVATAELVRRSSRRFRPYVGGGLAVVVLVAAFPFWSGNLYDETRTLDDIPDYWTTATSWLDDQPGDGRVLVLPATTRTRYRWGWVGDDIFDALLRRDHAIDTSIPLSNPRSTDLLRALTAAGADPAHRDGTVAAIARRLGIRYIVLRNDVDWQDQNVPRPARYDGLRSDPSLEQARTFGAPGQFTTSSRDGSEDAEAERRLPPIEILEVPGATGGPQLRGEGPSILVSGDGDAWPRLAAADLLTGAGVVRYTADLAEDDLRDAVAEGSPLVVTDTNRRHLDVVTGFRIDESHLLGPDEDLDRPTQSLFDRAGAETVAWFPDAESITATDASRTLTGFAPENRPAQAFDGDGTTAWFTPPFLDAETQTLTVELREPTELGEMTVTDARQIDARAVVRRVDVTIDDGPSRPLVLGADGDGTIDLGGTEGSRIEIAIGEAEGTQAGLAEVALGGLDLTEWVQLPDDIWSQAETDGSLDVLENVPLVIDMERERSASLRSVENGLRRRFRITGSRAFTVDASASVDDGTTDADIDALVGGSSPAVGSRRFKGSLDGLGAFAVDGDPSTAWASPPVAGETLTVRTGGGRSVEVRFDTGTDAVVPTVIEARSGDRLATARVVDGRAVLDFPGGLGETVEVSLAALPDAVGPMELPTRLTELSVDGSSPAAPEENGCRRGRLTADGVDVGLRSISDFSEIAALGAVRFTACGSLELDEGWHRLESTDRGDLDGVRLSTFAVPTTRAPDPAHEQVRVTADTRELSVDGGEGFVVLSGESYDDGWRADVDGRDLGPPAVLDTQSGWVVPAAEAASSRSVRLTYGPQRLVDAATAVTAVGLGFAAWFIWVGRRRRRRP